MTQMGLSFHLRSTNSAATNSRAAIQSRSAGLSEAAAPFHSAVTKMETPAEAIIATTAGRSPPSTPCTTDRVR